MKPLKSVIFLLFFFSIALKQAVAIPSLPHLKTEQEGYVGSIPLTFTDPFHATGIGTSHEGEMFVSGPSQIWGTTLYSDHFWERSLDMGEGSLIDTTKSYYDSQRNRLYVCRLKNKTGTPGGIVILEREKDGHFKWLKSMNFSNDKQSCGKISVIAGKYLLAINNIPANFKMERGAIYYQDLSESISEFPDDMDILQTYKDIFGDKTNNKVVSISSQGIASPQTDQNYPVYLMTKNTQNEEFSLAKLVFQEKKNAQGKTILVRIENPEFIPIKSKDITKPLDDFLNYDDHYFLFSDETTVYAEKCNHQSCTDPHDLTKGLYEKGIEAIAFGRDHFGRTGYPVFFVLPNSPNIPNTYNINEYSFNPSEI